MLKGKGKIFEKGESGGHVLYISSDITHDSAYPFHHGDEVQVVLDPEKKCLVISKKEA
jgi:hypothetical protein